MKTFNPFIHVGDHHVEIIGDCKNLKRLGESLIQKSKLDTKIQITLTDSMNNKPIKILSDNDLKLQLHKKTKLKDMRGK